METISLKPGESHLVRLKGLGSAGYQWMVESSDAMMKIIAVEEILHTRDEVKAPVAGSLDQRFKLTALAHGETVVRFSQRRRFEPGSKPHATFELQVTVTA
jgi:predicted secreted protein